MSYQHALGQQGGGEGGVAVHGDEPVHIKLRAVLAACALCDVVLCGAGGS